MLAILLLTTPFFLLVGIGFGLSKLRWIGPDSLPHLNRFVFKLALPSLLFKVTAETPASEIWQPNFVIVTVAAIMVAFIMGQLAFRKSMDAASAISAGFAGSHINGAIIGIPLCLMSFGEAALPAIAVTNLITGCLMLPTILALYGRADERGLHIGQIAKMAFANPLFIACGGGLTISLLGLELPAIISDTFDTIGRAAMPCALVSLGIFLTTIKLHHKLHRPLYLSVLKLGVQPVAAMALIALFPMPQVWANVAVVMAATPTASGTFLVVDAIGGPNDEIGQTIMVSTVLAIFSLPAWLYILG